MDVWAFRELENGGNWSFEPSASWKTEKTGVLGFTQAGKLVKTGVLELPRVGTWRKLEFWGFGELGHGENWSF
ncbi:MAG: hypothetical protein RIC35_21065 [Marinoscillum sp.]